MVECAFEPAIVRALSVTFPSVSSARPEPTLAEYELKFAFPGALASAVASWLASTCQPHPQFHDAIISSVYYDDPEWGLLNEKLNSDFIKRKLRLRWYRTPGALPSDSRAFIETKFKTGPRREKLRVPLETPAENFERTPLDAELFHRPLELLQHGVAGVTGMRPAFQVSYRRLRYVHPFSFSTFCLDFQITAPRVHRLRFRSGSPEPLAWAVFEQKGHLDRLDPLLDGLRRYGLRQTSFSKYLHCFHHLTEN